MCLDTIHEDKPEPEGYFWKVFRKVEKGIRLPYFYSGSPKEPVTRGEWLTAGPVEEETRTRIQSGDVSYPFGFHGFAERGGASNWGQGHLGHPDYPHELIRCKYRGGHTKGNQTPYGTVIVASEIYIPKDGEEI